ncbi:hypothetical protein G8O24_26465 [Bradyrhizobium sp. INPA01-394B]|uniref:ApeA N-terminal domain-containing protein n=1 Tax=Bradyrhizobium campsiandrae TaxID=1729892 RepID=A0ABR7U8B4_9BRAD|nr:hypothetical protein [Bradyrhizobium campsiandrae]MBC9880875.1 hypothetical protein [Bradyrhizobium campsiandrae]MBC9980291.1 hypothetical protein [Bradyrhizobium campsiandrae]
MGQKHESWIADGEKYALLGLGVKITDPAVGELDLSPNFRVIGGNEFTIPPEWREWLGSIRIEEVDACTLFIACKLKSSTPDVLDGENNLLTHRAWAFFRGLLLSAPFATAHRPVILTGSCRDGEVGLRQQQDLEAPVPNDFRPYPDITPDEIRQAAEIAMRLEKLAETRQGSNRWRFNRVLHLYTQTRTERDLLERIHQYARCIDGLILCDPGKSAKQFKSRSELFIGPKHHDLMGEIYEVRSAVEHLHEDRYLDPVTRHTQIDLTKKEAIIEYIARTTLSRIVLDETLWPHFTSKASLTGFWAQADVNRKLIWGSPIDPMAALEEFDERYLPGV